MSPLATHAQEYLRLRNAFGHDLAEAARLLPRFVAYLEAIGATTVTLEAAIAWAQQPDTTHPDSKIRARRMTIARGFARHMAGIDPQTQVPPLGLIPYRKRWRPPYIYTHREIRALMSGTVQVIASAQRAVTYATLIGLLAATGMRVGEALRLQAHDTDLVDGVITIRASKFGKSRQLPLSTTTNESRPTPATATESILAHGRRRSSSPPSERRSSTPTSESPSASS